MNATLAHLLCAVAAFVVAASLSAPPDSPRARPWLGGFALCLAMSELYVAVLTGGLTLRWPILHWLGAPWIALLPLTLVMHRRSRRRAPRVVVRGKFAHS
jgi:hypothetical protein